MSLDPTIFLKGLHLTSGDTTLRHCDQAVAEAVNTIIYAAPRTEVKELNVVRDQLIVKFGKDFAVAAMENQNDIVNSRVCFGDLLVAGCVLKSLNFISIRSYTNSRSRRRIPCW